MYIDVGTPSANSLKDTSLLGHGHGLLYYKCNHKAYMLSPGWWVQFLFPIHAEDCDQ